MAVLDNILQSQISDLQRDVKDLTAAIKGIAAGCELRHKKDISAEIVRLETELENLEKELRSFEITINNNADAVEKLKSDLNELAGRVNIIVLKVEQNEEFHRKLKDNKSNFIMQTAIIVVAGLISAILSIVGTLIWTGVKQVSNNNNRNNSARIEHVKK